MGRIDDFTDFNTNTGKDVTGVLDQTGASVQVYRKGASADGKPGFSVELLDYSFIKNILAFIDPAPGQANYAIGSQGRKSASFHNAMTAEDDVRVGDFWQHKEMKYRVLWIDKTYPGKTDVRLEVFK